MKRLVFAAAAVLLLSVPAYALDVVAEEAEILGTDTLVQALDGDAAAQMDGLSPAKRSDFGHELWRLVTNAISGSGNDLRQAAGTAAKLLSAVILCAFVGSMDTGISKNAVIWAGVLAMTVIFSSELSGLRSEAEQTLHRIADFTALLLPVLSSALAASGGISASAALYTGANLFLSVLTAVVRSVLLPLVGIYVLLCAAECVAGEGRLSKLQELMGWFSSMLLKAVVYLFTAYLAVTGLLSGSADTMTAKAAKTALSGAVPVVGSILSEASDAILAGAGVLKATTGIFGMLSILAICLAPFVRLAIHYLILRLTAAVCAAVGEAAHARLLSGFTAAMGLLLAMTGAALIMALVSVCCFMKAVTP